MHWLTFISLEVYLKLNHSWSIASPFHNLDLILNIFICFPVVLPSALHQGYMEMFWVIYVVSSVRVFFLLYYLVILHLCLTSIKKNYFFFNFPSAYLPNIAFFSLISFTYNLYSFKTLSSQNKRLQVTL